MTPNTRMEKVLNTIPVKPTMPLNTNPKQGNKTSKIRFWSAMNARLFVYVMMVMTQILGSVFGFGSVTLNDLFTIPAAQAAEGINRTINYQGRLMDASGTNVTDGDYGIAFTIYDAATGGSQIWSASTTNGLPTGTIASTTVSVQSGLFTILLGDTSDNQVAFPADMFNSDSLYLGVAIGSDSEMTPRKRLSAVPYAFNSETLQGQYASNTVANTGGDLFALNQNTADSASASRTALGIYTEGTSDVYDFLIRANSGSDVFTISRSGNVTTTGNLQVDGVSLLGSATTTGVTFNGYINSDFNPYTDNTYSLGSLTYRWKNLYATNVSSTNIDALGYVSTTNLFLNGNQFTGDLQSVTDVNNITDNPIGVAGVSTTGNILPTATLTYDLGSTSNRWKDIWASSTYIGDNTWNLRQNANDYFTIADVGGNELVTVDTFGNVGIGTSTYSGLLTMSTTTPLSSNIRLFSVYNNGIERTWLNSNGGQAWKLSSNTYESGTLAYSTPGGNPSIYIFDPTVTNKIYLGQQLSTGYFYLGVSTDGSAPEHQLVLNNNGYLGLGDTTPDSMIDIVDSSANNTQISIANTNAGSYDSQIGFQLVDNTNLFTMGVDDSDSDKFKISTTGLGTNDRLVIDSAGNVGISNTNPVGKLDVISSNFPVGKFTRLTDINNDISSGYLLKTQASGDMVDGFGGGIVFDIQDNTSGENHVATLYGIRDGADNSGALTFRTYLLGSPNERMRITSDGNVGIGDTSPLALFTVGNGDLFQVSSTGNLAKISGVDFVWPSSQGSSNTFLKNDGTGTLTWATVAGGSIPSWAEVTLVGATSSEWISFYGATSTGSILAGANNQYDLGSFGNAWKDVYASGTIYGSAVSVKPSANTMSVVTSTSLASSGGAMGMEVIGDYAFISDLNSGDFVIKDISDRVNPKTVGSLDTGYTGLGAVQVIGDYAYVYARFTTSNFGLSIIDITSSTNPVEVGYVQSLSYTNAGYELYTNGNYVYFGDYQNSQVDIVDVTDPTNPTFVKSVSAGNPYAITGSGNYVYSLPRGATDDPITIIDVSDPVNAFVVGTANTNATGDIIDMAVSGNNLYVHAGQEFIVLDISDPAHPVEKDSIGMAAAAGPRPQTMVATEKYVYTFTNDYLVVFDVTDQSDISIATQKYLGATLWTLDVQGNYAYIIDSSRNLKIVDLGGIETHSIQAYSGYFSNLTISGMANMANDAVIGGKLTVSTDGIYNQGALDVVGTATIYGTSTVASIMPHADSAYDLGSSSSYWRNLYADTVNTHALNLTPGGFTELYSVNNSVTYGATAVKVVGDIMYMGVDDNIGSLGVAGQDFQILDVSDPSNPKYISGLEFSTGQVYDIEVEGNYAYLAGQDMDTTYGANLEFVVMEISDPYNPTVVFGSDLYYGNSYPARALKIADNYAYLGGWDLGNTNDLRIYNISNPTSPSYVGGVNFGGWIYGLELLNDKYLVVGTDDATSFSSEDIVLLDISDPSNPTYVDGIDNGSYQVPALAVRGDTIFAGTAYANPSGNKEFLIIDASSSTNLSVIGGLDMGTHVIYDIALANDYAYVLQEDGYNNVNEISVVNISSSTNPTYDSGLDLGATSYPNDLELSGATLYVGLGNTGTSKDLYIFDIGGLNTFSANIGNLWADEFSISRDGKIGNNLYVKNDIYAEYLGLSGSAALGGTLSVKSTSTMADITPHADSTYDLGTSSNYWRNLYADSVNTHALNLTPGALTEVYSTNNSSLYGTEVVKVVGNTMYIGISNNIGSLGASGEDFQIIDVSNPDDPKYISGLQFSTGRVLDIEILGNYAYVVGSEMDTSAGANQEFAVIDISDPYNPNVVYGAWFTNIAYTVEIADDYLYIGGYDLVSTGEVVVYDISNPILPVYTGGINVGNWVYDLELLNDNYLVVGTDDATAFFSEDILLLDISDPSNLTYVDGVNSGSNAVKSLAVKGNTIYAGTSYANPGGVSEFIVIDSASSTDLTVLGGVSLGTKVIEDIVLANNYAYVLQEDSSGSSGNEISIIDISSSTSPTYYSGLDLGATSYANDLELSGGKLYAAFGNTASTNDLYIFDIGGLNTHTANIGNLWADEFNISRDGKIGNDLYVKNDIYSEYIMANSAVVSGGGLFAQTTSSMATILPNSNNLYDLGGGGLSWRNIYASGTTVTNNVWTQNIDAANPIVSVVNSVSIGGYTYGPSDIVGNYLYTYNMLGTNSLDIWDVSVPSSPSSTGYISASNVISDIKVQGKYAYVSLNTNYGNGDMEIFDISNPQSPVKLDRIGDTSGMWGGLDVAGRYAYKLNATTEQLRIYDVNDPNDIKLVSSIATQGIDPSDVSVQGKYAYIINNNSGTLSIIDIEDPLNPAFVATTTIGTAPVSIQVQGRYAYVAHQNASINLTITDISKPEDPTLIAGINTGAYPNSNQNLNSVTVAGRYVYLTGNVGAPGTRVIDVQDPYSPKVVASYSETNMGGAAVSGQYVYVTGYNGKLTTLMVGGINTNAITIGSAELGDLNVLGSANIFNGLNVNGGLSVGIRGIHSDGTLSVAATSTLRDVVPLVHNTYDLGTTALAWRNIYASGTATVPNIWTQNINAANPSSSNISEVGYLTGITEGAMSIQGNYLYKTQGGNGTRMMVIDITNPASPSSTATVQLQSYSYGIKTVGDYAYTTYDGGFEVIDISNPKVPVRIATIPTGSGNTSPDVAGHYLYIPEATGETLRIYDISNPSSPSLASSIATQGTDPKNVVVQGNYAYVTNYSSANISIIDISNPLSPVFVATSTVGTAPASIAVQNRYVYTIHYTSNYLSITDVLDPSNPVLIQNLTLGSIISYYHPQNIKVVGNYAYIGMNNGYVYIVDISTPYNARIVASKLLTNNINGIEVSGRYVYASVYGGRFSVLDIGGIETNALSAASVLAGNLRVSTDADINKLKTNNLIVGPGGALLNGSLSVQSTSTFSDIKTTGRVNSNWLPYIDNTYDLGSATYRWRNLQAVNASFTTLYVATSGITNAFIQDGNSFGATAVLGTNDNNKLTFETNGTTRMELDTSGNLSLDDNLIAQAGELSIVVGSETKDSFLETYTGDMSTGLLIRNGNPSADYGIIRQESGNNYTSGWDQGLHIFTNNSGHDDSIIFTTNGTERLRLDEYGSLYPSVNISQSLGTSTNRWDKTWSGIYNIGTSTYHYMTTLANGSFSITEADGSNIINIGRDYSSRNKVAVGSRTLGSNTGQFNTAIGDESTLSGTGSYNTAVGASSLYDLSSGASNTAVGFESLYSNTTGYYNTALGAVTLRSNTNGYLNTAIGVGVLFANQGGHHNIGMGPGVLYNNVSGNFNIGIGDGALYTNTASDNIAIGESTLGANTIGTLNVAIGTRALSANISGNNNVAIGNRSSNTKEAGNENTTIGDYTYYSFLGGNYNTALGSHSMYGSGSDQTAHYNTGIGAYSLYSLNTGASNTAVGFESMYSNTDGFWNTAVGLQSMRANTTGAVNTALGVGSLFSNQDGGSNVALGAATLYSNISGDDNIAIGNSALYDNLTSDNIAIGKSALSNNTSGTYNTAIGIEALSNDDIGIHNTALGYNAMLGLPNGIHSYNTAVGSQAGYSMESGTSNTAVGYMSLYDNTSGYWNSALGINALKSNVSGFANTAIGGLALENNTTASQNTAVGLGALWQNATGSHNTAIGESTIVWNTNGMYNTALGSEAMNGNEGDSGYSYNTAVGARSLYQIQTGASNTTVGFEAGRYISTGSENVAVGNQALLSNTTASNNVAVGAKALSDNTTSTFNTAVGTAALWHNTGRYNSAFGTLALAGNTWGEQNSAFGVSALANNTTGDENTAMGANALYSNSSGYHNVALGSSALYDLNTGWKNIAIGWEASTNMTNSAYNIAIGAEAMHTATTLTYNNIAIGNSSMYYINGGDYNIAIGENSMNGVTTGNYNIGIGYEAASSVTAGLKNVALGYQALRYVTSSNNIAIGDGALSNAVWSLGNNIGIGTNAGAFTMGFGGIAIGNGAGNNADGDYNVAIGFGAMPYDDVGENVAIGYAAGAANASGQYFTAIGAHTGGVNSTGDWNTFIGSNVAVKNTVGGVNTAVGAHSLYYNVSGGYNTSLGQGSLWGNTASYNTAIGAHSAFRATSGVYNTSLGYRSLYGASSTGDYNTSLGVQTLEDNSSGHRNTAVGSIALTNNTTGYYNTAVGVDSMQQNTQGYQNTALGFEASLYNTLGDNNTAIGHGAMRGTSGNSHNNNTAVGIESLYAITSGFGNTAVGGYAGNGVWSGNYNTLIGYGADIGTSNLANGIAIGYNASVTSSNTVRIGNNSINSIGGYANWSNVSDSRLKQNVVDTDLGLDFINKLRPVKFEFIAQPGASVDGFIAQEVKAAMESEGTTFSGLDDQEFNAGGYYYLEYGTFVAPLTKAVQELYASSSPLYNGIDISPIFAGYDESFMQVDADGNIATRGITIAKQAEATTSTPAVDSYTFSFNGSAWNASTSQEITTSFRMFNNTISATSSELKYAYTTGTGFTQDLLTITNMGDMHVSGDLHVGRRLYLGSNTTGEASTSTYIFVDDTLSPTSTYIATNADGWQTETTYDYAERYESSEELMPGDLVTADPNGVNLVKRATSPTEPLLGIVSTKPGFVTGRHYDGWYPIALAGRVPTRISTINGAIKVGDYITASDDNGVGVKAIGPGNVIGIALESYDSPEEGLISVFVKPSYTAGTIIASAGQSSGSVVINQTTTVTEERVEIEGLAMINFGQTEVHISFGSLLAYPMVYATPHASIDGSWWVANRTDAGFDIILSQPQGHNVEFTWLAKPMQRGTIRFISDNTYENIDDLTGNPIGPTPEEIIDDTATSTSDIPDTATSTPDVPPADDGQTATSTTQITNINTTDASASSTEPVVLEDATASSTQTNM